MISDTKVKLIILLGSLEGGGAERCMLNLVKSLDKDNYSVTLVLAKGDMDYDVTDLKYVDIIILNASKVSLCGFKLRRVVRKINPDVILSATYMMAIVAGVFIPKRYSLIIRESCIVSGRFNSMGKCSKFFQKILYSYALKKASTIICQSKAMKEDLISYLGIFPCKLKRIPNMVDVNNFDKYKKELISNDKLQLIYIGRLHFEKGLDVLLRAISLVNRDCQLMILGKGPAEKKLKELARSLNIKNVIWKGFQADPHYFIHKSAVLVLPSRTEGFPNVVLEAGAIGVPTIAFRRAGGTCDVISEGINGCLLDFSSEALADAIECFDDEAYDVNLIKEYVGNKFGSKKISMQYDKLFKLRL